MLQAIGFANKDPGHEGELGDMPFVESVEMRDLRGGWARVLTMKTQPALDVLTEVRGELEVGGRFLFSVPAVCDLGYHVAQHPCLRFLERCTAAQDTCSPTASPGLALPFCRFFSSSHLLLKGVVMEGHDSEIHDVHESKGHDSKIRGEILVALHGVNHT